MDFSLKPDYSMHGSDVDRIKKLEKKVFKLSLGLLAVSAFSFGSVIYITFLLIYSVTLRNQLQAPALLLAPVAFLESTTKLPKTEGKCESGWSYLSDTDTGFCYKAWPQKRITQSLAKRFCQNQQANLVSIRSFVEDQFVLELASENQEITRIWIGIAWNELMSLRRWEDGTIENVYDNGVVSPGNLTKDPTFSKDWKHPFGAKCIRCEQSGSEGVWYFLENEKPTDPQLVPDGFVCKKRRSYFQNQSPLPNSENKCDSHWVFFQGTNFCYHLQNFTSNNVVDSKLFTMMESENNCQLMGGHLVSIHNNDEREFVKNLLITNLKPFLLLSDSDFGCSNMHSAWIGLRQVNGTRK
ncbi:unnamed protein product, partial [Mesorhabditis belari]|uniref:C-type lectin domain-containing protein n=1 Tax=Mesorhabditis belari TaxID=2138241 RepID=A0AAF3EI31_9BILA